MMKTRLFSVDCRLLSVVSGLFVALVFLSSCGGGGGGDNTTGPGPVASVEVTAPSTTLEVGAIMLVSVKYFDARRTQLSGKSVTYTSSNSSVATVDNGGTVTGVAVGAASIQATVDGVAGSVSISVVPVPIASIAITPANPSVRQGETATLTAQPLDAVGRPLTGRVVSWSSATPAIATIDASSGLVTGVAAGTVYIRAESEGKRDSVRLRVKSLNAPAITSSSPALITPGALGTLTGNNFGATPNDNEVFVNGAKATVTAASVSSVSFIAPPALALPCKPTGPATVLLVANGDSATTSMSLSMAVPRTLAVGESALLTSQADLFCNEFAVTGGRYLVTAFNYGANAGIKTSFTLLGASSAVAASQPAASIQPPQLAPSLGAPVFDGQATRHVRAHLALQQRERAVARQYGNPRLRQRMRRNGAQLSVSAVNPPPQVGDMTTYRMQRTLGNYSAYDEVRFRAAYVGSKIIIYEDSLAPLARSMDAEFRRLGEEFDQVTWPILLNFGNPIVVDSALDNNGHVIALFSNRVNNYTVSGISNAILGFVTLCDYFPRTAQVIGGVTIPACPASNEAEAFYAMVPQNTATSGSGSIGTWRRFMRGTLAHEVKHITSYAERYYRDADVADLEELWLEEATAQQASEMFARAMYNGAQLGDIGWLDGPRCDYAAVSPTCPDPAEGILHHFSFLYDHYNALESKSILDDPDAPIDPVIYGSSWSFARWVTDVFGASEGTFLRSIVQVKTDHGVPNIASKAGRPFSELLGLWSLASLADNYPGATINDTRLRLHGWNSRNLFSEMSANLVFPGGTPAFPKPWPLNVRLMSFGDFPTAQADVTLLPGGGFMAWDISGVQAASQILAIRDPNGGLPPPLIGMAILRVQ